MRYGRLAKVGYNGWMALAAPAGYQVTLPLQDTHIAWAMTLTSKHWLLN